LSSSRSRDIFIKLAEMGEDSLDPGYGHHHHRRGPSILTDARLVTMGTLEPGERAWWRWLTKR
jgi:hypothetical protein